MNIQRKKRRFAGNDTFVRSVGNDAFAGKSTESFEIVSGEISITQPEPFFRQNAVTVQLTKGGTVSGVAYPGAFIDPLTGNLHGSYDGPIPGQMVNIGFLNGNSSAPFVVNRYPYQGVGNTLTEIKYLQPLTKKLYDATDVLMGHFSGSVIRLNTGLLSGKLPGSISIESITNTEITALTTVKLTGLTIELNGNTNWAVKYTELKVAFDQLKSDYDTFVTTKYNLHSHATAATGPPVATITIGAASTADMTAAKNLTVLM